MTNVVELVPSQPQPEQDVVSELEMLLEKAKAGEITSLAYVCVFHPSSDMETMNGIMLTSGKDSQALGFALSRLHHDFYQRMIGEAVDVPDQPMQ